MNNQDEVEMNTKATDSTTDVSAVSPEPVTRSQVASEEHEPSMDMDSTAFTSEDESNIAMLPEKPLAASSTSSMPSVPIHKSPHRKLFWVTALVVVIGIAAIAGGMFGAYRLGQNHEEAGDAAKQATSTAVAALKVPANATMVAQCTTGEGTQYELPSSIPNGPIYNVWNNKVTGIEYMVDQQQITSMMAQDLTLMGQQFNHVDIMYEAAGHAGFAVPHYHLIFSMIPFSQEQKITCGGSTNSSMAM